METQAKLNYLRMSPRKVRLVASLIKGMGVRRAEAELSHLPKRAGTPLLKLLRSAIASAKHNLHLEQDELRVKQVIVGGGPTLKRYRARAFGKAARVRKRITHISLVLGTKEVQSSK